MKKLLVFLALSLAANAAFLVTFFVRPSVAHSSAAAPEAAAAGGPAAFLDASGTGLTAADAGALKRSGELLLAGDLRRLVARLRAAGFPPSLIRAIITAQVTEQYGARRKAVVAHQEVVPYWRSSQSFPHDAKAGAEIARLNREQAALIKDLLGPDSTPTDEWSRLLQERKYGSLSQDKIDRLQAIQNDYSDLRSQLMADSRGIILAEDREKFQLLEQEQRTDLVKLFTPEELEEYDLRNSNLANQLRFQLSAFNASEEEFRTIFRLNLANNPNALTQGPFGMNQVGPNNGTSRQSELQAQIEAALGPARGAEYKQTTNPAYQQASLLLTRLDLPTSLASQIISVQQDTEQRANAVRQDRSLSVEERSNQLAALSDEAQAKLTSTLGERGVAAYRNFGGWWLNNLKPHSGQGSPAFQFGVPPKT